MSDKIELKRLCGVLCSNILFISQSESRTQSCHVRITVTPNLESRIRVRKSKMQQHTSEVGTDGEKSGPFLQPANLYSSGAKDQVEVKEERVTACLGDIYKQLNLTLEEIAEKKKWISIKYFEQTMNRLGFSLVNFDITVKEIYEKKIIINL